MLRTVPLVSLSLVQDVPHTDSDRSHVSRCGVALCKVRSCMEQGERLRSSEGSDIKYFQTPMRGDGIKYIALNH